MGRIFERTWWIVGIRGLVAALLGLGALFWPEQTVNILKLMFALLALAYGGLTLFGVWQNRENLPRLPLIKGIAAVVIGVIALIWDSITGQILLYLIAAYSGITGVLDIGGAFQLRADQQDMRPFQLGSGIASLVFAVILVIQPNGITQNVLVGLYFLVIGGIGMFLGYRVRQAPQAVEEAAV